MNTALKDISSNLNDLKLITSTQVDLSYFNSLVSSVFSDPTIYANIQSDVQFINQIGGQLFNYFTACWRILVFVPDFDWKRICTAGIHPLWYGYSFPEEDRTQWIFWISPGDFAPGRISRFSYCYEEYYEEE